MDKYINTPITEETTKDLHSGDYVYITGTIYVARDAAHKRMIEALDSGENLPIDIKDSTIYYMGPSPAREGRPIGSAGPTTATRMDKYAPTLLDLGEKAMIGKGKRSQEVIEAIILGVVQGLTELLPVSSSAHLYLLSEFFFKWTISDSFDIVIAAKHPAAPPPIIKMSVDNFSIFILFTY